MEAITDTQKEFEYKVCKLLKFNSSNSIIMQRDGTEQMIIDNFSGDIDLSGTVAYKRSAKDFLLVATKDSEVNHIEAITFKMIKEIIKSYCSAKMNKVTLATNLPIEIHSSKAKDLKKDFNFHIINIGYSFCQKHNLEFTSIY